MAVRDEGSDPRTEVNTALSFALDHPTLLAFLAAALIFAIRCVVVSHGDLYTASILLAQTSLGDAIRALLFSTGRLLLTGISFGLMLLAVERDRLLAIETLGLGAGSAVAFLLASYISPSSWASNVAAYLTFLAFSFFSFRFLNRRRGRLGEIGREPIVPRRILISVLILWTVYVFSAYIATDAFWLPRERLVFIAEQPFTGYVLRSNDDHFVIMYDDPRVIVEKPKASLSDRDFCNPYRPANAAPKSIQSNLPVCPRS
jgi:hypothetical protein